MAVLDCRGCGEAWGQQTITAACRSLQMLGENVPVVDASPDNLLRLSFNVDFTHRQVGPELCWMAMTGVTPGCAIPAARFAAFGQLSIEEQEIHSTGKPG